MSTLLFGGTTVAYAESPFADDASLLRYEILLFDIDFLNALGNNNESMYTMFVQLL